MLFFPIQMMKEEESKTCEDLTIHYWQARLATLDAVRRFSQVEDLSSESVREINQLVDNFNIHAVEYGYPILNVRFD